MIQHGLCKNPDYLLLLRSNQFNPTLYALQISMKRILTMLYYFEYNQLFFVPKVCIFWEGHTILWNLHCRFVLCSNNQIYGGNFAKHCGLLRIYKLYQMIGWSCKANNCPMGSVSRSTLSRDIVELRDNSSQLWYEVYKVVFSS